MADQTFDPLAMAQAELTDQVIPDAEQLLEALSPFAQLYYLQQTGYYVLAQMTRHILEDTEGEIGETDEPFRAMMALTEGLGNIDGACKLLGLMPEGL
jgi:hypothetical protein